MSAFLAKLFPWVGGRSAAPIRTAAPRVPDGEVVYAIGDIHGERALLDQALSAIRADAASLGSGLALTMVFLGDYVDRGPNSRGVLDLLCGAPLPGFTCHFLMGNHEWAMLEFLDNPGRGADWMAFGGAETLGSYGVRGSVGAVGPARLTLLAESLAARLPDAHRDFLTALKPMLVKGDYVFVHAGIRPGRPLAKQALEDLLWIRETFTASPDRHEKVVVHGHSISEQPEIRANRIGIDTGAYATGRLTAIALQGDQVRILSGGSIDDKPADGGPAS